MDMIKYANELLRTMADPNQDPDVRNIISSCEAELDSISDSFGITCDEDYDESGESFEVDKWIKGE